MTDLHFIIWVSITYLVAGIVKGVIGSGMPTIGVGVLTAVLGLHPALALMLVPTTVTNIWQALVGGHFRAIFARAWPFLLPATLTIFIGALALTRVNVAWLSALLGLLLAVYGVFGLLRPPFMMARSKETAIGVVAGLINGTLGGMTGSFGMPGIPYLQAMGMPRDEFIQALGILFTMSTLALAIALGGEKLLTADLGLASALALIPALVGMVIGTWLRRRLSEDRFRKVFFASQILLGGYIVLRAVLH
jgi:uncharacterized membrane protein YfcA